MTINPTPQGRAHPCERRHARNVRLFISDKNMPSRNALRYSYPQLDEYTLQVVT
jgi:hypothetical protein